MIGRNTAAKSILALTAITTFSSMLLIDTATAQSSKTSNKQYAQIVRTLAKLNQGLASLNTQIANQKPVVVVTPNVAAPAATPAPAASTATPAPVVTAAPTPPQSPIGKNEPSNSYISFDFYDGRIGEAVSYHNESGIGIAFRIREQGVSGFAQEYKLNFPFGDRTAEQRTADAFIIQTCLSHFHRAADAPTGGTFYINPNKDNKLGLLCASIVTK